MIDLEEIKKHFDVNIHTVKELQQWAVDATWKGWALIAEVERLRELSAVKGEYIKLLEEMLQSLEEFTHIPTFKEINAGDELQTKIKELEENHD